MSQQNSHTEAFTLDAPASAGHIPSIRSFAADVAAAHGAPPDDVADVRLAVSELASAIVAQDAEEIGLRIAPHADRLSVTIGPWAQGPPSGDDVDPWDLVTSLFEDARVEGDCVAFSFTLAPT